MMVEFGMLLLQSWWFFLPAYVANMAPEFVKKLPWTDPIWEKKLGSHKTWRGLVVACLAGVLVFWLQKWLFQFGVFNKISLIDYADFSVLLGFLLGLGAILGDAVGSFYKRRQGLAPGKSWIPWDQLDFVIGGLVLSWFVYVPQIGVALIILVTSFFLHLGVSRIGYWLKIKKEKY